MASSKLRPTYPQNLGWGPGRWWWTVRGDGVTSQVNILLTLIQNQVRQDGENVPLKFQVIFLRQVTTWVNQVPVTQTHDIDLHRSPERHHLTIQYIAIIQTRVKTYNVLYYTYLYKSVTSFHFSGHGLNMFHFLASLLLYFHTWIHETAKERLFTGHSG